MKSTHGGMTAGWEHFEPQQCRDELLRAGIVADKWFSGDNSINYRKLDRAKAATMARDMAKGAWDQNGETVKFNENGLLIDGQKRFLASVLSGSSFWSLSVRGVRSQSTIDTGTPRSFVDELRHRNIPNARDVAPVVRILFAHSRHQLHSLEYKGAATRLELIGCFEQQEENLVDFVGRCSEVRQRGTVTAIAYIGSCGVWSQFSEHLMEGLRHGNDLPKDDPVLILRERLNHEAMNPHSRILPKARLAMIIKAWNSLCEGASATRESIQWRATGPDREPFPEIECISGPESDSATGEPIGDLQPRTKRPAKRPAKRRSPQTA